MKIATHSNEIVQHPSELLDEKQTAEFLMVKPGTLSVWRSTGRYNIPFIKVGRRVRYRRADLLAWLEAHTHSSTGESETWPHN